jgi:hypothetical protein
MKPILTIERLPMTVGDGKEDVWWFNNHNSSWSLGTTLLINFDDPETYEKWTHWLPENEIQIPDLITDEPYKSWNKHCENNWE